jgi:hypothetical protein
MEARIVPRDQAGVEWLSIVEIEGKRYALEYDPRDAFVAPGLRAAFCDEIARDFMPVIFDPWGHGARPHPPESIAYRLVVDPENQRLCILYEVYWIRQDCTWMELNKDHDHDYEQIQVHFDLESGCMARVVVSSVGPVSCAGHGVEVYSDTLKPMAEMVEYTTSPKGAFPWGGDRGQDSVTQVREMPIEQLVFDDNRPVAFVLNCYHAFAGYKGRYLQREGGELNPRLVRLDRELLNKWYYRHAKNRFGHDISKPFDEPYIMYYPPPEDWVSRIVYFILWLLSRLS